MAQVIERLNMAKQRLTEDTPFLRTPDMYQIESDAPISEYSEQVLDRIADARNGGVPDGANAFCSVGKEKRGTVQMQLFGVLTPKPRRFPRLVFAVMVVWRPSLAPRLSPICCVARRSSRHSPSRPMTSWPSWGACRWAVATR